MVTCRKYQSARAVCELVEKADYLTGHFCTEHLTLVATPPIVSGRKMKFGYLCNTAEGIRGRADAPEKIDM